MHFVKIMFIFFLVELSESNMIKVKIKSMIIKWLHLSRECILHKNGELL
ncbi:hypothetical protein XBFM1_2420026 [Xenorhabdus bovienii str. feltiae Moldova]|uniref:Uncharacterized protein n=1 Tax=Xenorhabdus bovienii str. feltiae Moldova TaxID=1398200 RepID=A0A077NWG9_XENBV|nr:hypothetical protein XBFM1_2420026 [Xenorhabdus bovienii str. feltiae Moldova]